MFVLHCEHHERGNGLSHSRRIPWADLILSSSGALEPFLRAGTANHRDACRVRKWRQCQPQRDEVSGVAKGRNHI